MFGCAGFRYPMDMAWKKRDYGKDALDTLRELTKRARFLADEDLDSEIAEYLRERRYNVRVATELRGHQDEDQLAAAFRENRILLTNDRGFLDPQRHPPHRNPGVIVLPGGSGNTRQMARGVSVLVDYLADLQPVIEGAYIEITASGQVYVTSRNVETGAMETTRYRFDRPDLEIWSDDD